MNHILFPTDFSPASLNAFQYAVQLAQKYQSRITLFHAYMVNLIEPYMSSFMQEALINQQEDLALSHFAELEKQVPANILPKTQLDFKISMGPAVDEILYVSEELKPDTIVMGMRGGNVRVKKIFGTIATGVIQRSRCPVMVIPESVAYNDINHIAYATDFDQEDPAVIDHLLAFAQSSDAIVHCIHIRKDGLARDFYKQEILRKAYQHELEIHDLEIHSLKEQDVVEGIQRFAGTHQIDLLVLLTHPRSFLGRIFHRSITRQISIVSQIPLLVFQKGMVPNELNFSSESS